MHEQQMENIELKVTKRAPFRGNNLERKKKERKKKGKKKERKKEKRKKARKKKG